MKRERTRDEISSTIKLSILKKRIAIAETQLDWYKNELEINWVSNGQKHKRGVPSMR